jgi:hypothetical protein
MDMRSLEHCLNDITNTAGVQSDLKGESRSNGFCALPLLPLFAPTFNRFFRRRSRSARSEEAKSSLKSIYKRFRRRLCRPMRL